MLIEPQSNHSQAVERRGKPRISGSYPAIVQGLDASGKKIRVNATLVNLSATGLCLILKPQIRLDAKVFVLFRYSITGPLGKSKAPLIAIRGVPVRSGTTSQGLQTFAAKIQRSRFL